jgi:hypothetical protein
MRAGAPPTLPRTSEELAAWGVFGDQLQEAGDRLGELISLDLALGLTPSAAALAEFQTQARSLCRAPRNLEVAWCLGFARTARVRAGWEVRRTSARFEIAPEEDFHALFELLGEARGSRLEALIFPLSAKALEARHFRAALARLPATCERVELTTADALSLRELVGLLPSTVRSLRLPCQTSALALEGLDQVPVAWDFRGLATRQSFDTVQSAFESLTARGSLSPRVVFGAPGDAALLNLRTWEVALLERCPLSQLQRWFGIVSAQAQVERALPESFQLSEHHVSFAPGRGVAAFVRRRGGVWSIARHANGQVVRQFSREGYAVGPLRTGEQVELAGDPWTLMQHHVHEAWLEHLAPRIQR